MKVMKFNVLGGGLFMGVEGDMLVHDFGERNANGMAWVRNIDDRSTLYGDSFWAYPSELSVMATCPMEVNRE